MNASELQVSDASRGYPCDVSLLKAGNGKDRVYDLIGEGGEIISQMVAERRQADVSADGTTARLSRREWSNEWRLRCQADVSSRTTPPDNSGDRITSSLSDRGATALGESCEFVTVKRKGYSTFLTLTLDEAARERIVTRKAEPVYRTIPTVRKLGKGKIGLLVMPGVVSWGAFSWIAFNELHGRTCEGLIGEIVGGAGYGSLEKDYSQDKEFGRVVVNAGADGPFCRVRFVWVSSLQREVSRFFDGMQKMYSRGWMPEYRRGFVNKPTKFCKVAWNNIQEKIDFWGEYTPITWNDSQERISLDGAPFCLIDKKKPLKESLDYLWVAENPWVSDPSDVGPGRKRNPHIHVLLRWRVPYALFPCWSKRIENLWGQGFAHLEKLKNSEAAGYYIAKAAGYLTKSNSGSDQGPIRGNRYGISAKARAPGWEPVLVWAWGVLGHLIEDAREIWNKTAAPLRKKRDDLKWELKSVPNENKKKRAKVAALLMNARREIKKLPAWFGKYSATFKTIDGRDDSLDRFIEWAKRRGWTMGEKPNGRWLGEWLKQRWARIERRRYLAAHKNMCLGEWLSALRSYTDYEDDRWELVGAGGELVVNYKDEVY